MKVVKTTPLLKFYVTFCLLLTAITIVQAQNMQEGINDEELLKYDAAKSVYNSILAKDPSNAAAYYHLGIIAYHNFQYDSAHYLFNKGIAVKASEPLNYVGTGLLALRQKNYEQARQNFDKALALSNNKDAYVMQQIVDCIWLEQDAKDADYAFDLINKAIALKGNDPRIGVSLGDAYRLKGDGGKGINQYESIESANPKYLLAQLRIGQAYLKVKSYPAAQEIFNKILAEDPNYPPLYPELADMYFEQGNVPKARENYEKFLSLVGTSPAERLRYASFLYLIKDYKGALEQANIVEKSLPDNTVILRIKAYCEYETSDFTNGLNSINKLFSTAKKEDIIGRDYTYLGKLLSKNGQDSLAIVNLYKGLKDDSTNVDLYDMIAESYGKLKKYNDAANVMEKKLALTKDNIAKQDYFTLGRYYFYAGNYQKADTNFAMVTKYFPTYAVGYLYRAESNSYIDSTMKTGAAKPFYEKFLEVSAPDSAKFKNQIIEADMYLGTYYYNHNNMDKAKEYFEKVKAIDPANKNADDAIKAINAGKKRKAAGGK